MKFYIGVTDNQWYRFLAERQPDEVNFWRPGGGSFKAVDEGSLFLFKLHSPLNYIVGGGFFVRYTVLPLSLAWEAFGEKNGASIFMTFYEQIAKYRQSRGGMELNPDIGCIILTQPFFFDRADWIPIPKDWHPNIVQGKTYDTAEPIGAAVYAQVEERLQSYQWPFEYKEECIPQCQKIRKVSTETESNTFCLDKTCYKNKEKAATTNRSEAEEEQTTQAAPIVADDGTVDIDAQDVDYTPLANAQFDTAACEACGHKHIAVWKSNDEQFRMPACFEPGDCYQQKTREAMAERHRKIGNENTIERWLRTVLPGKLSGDTDAQLSLIGACALNLDGFEWGLDSAMEAAAESAGIEDINALLQNGLLSYAETIFGELVKAAELPHLMPLATHAGVNINEWKPDDIWFQDLDKAELVELLINIQAYDESDSSRLKSMQNHELIERALDHAQKVPVPDEITEAWERLNSGGRVDDGELE